jgi:hypothetical protein
MSMARDDRTIFTADEAIELLADGEYVHVICNSAAAVLIGADWPRSRVIAAIRESEPEKSGDMACGMGHGLFILHDGRRLFIATKTEPARAERIAS